MGNCGSSPDDDDDAVPTNKYQPSTAQHQHQHQHHQHQQHPGPAVPVYLNVYNLQPVEKGKSSFNQKIGFGVYHSGVEVLGREFSFGGAPGAPANHPGIFVVPPRMAMPPEQFHEQILVGRVHGLTVDGLRQIIQRMSPSWLAASYHLLSHNCCSFSAAFLKEISKQYNLNRTMKMPGYVDRTARLGDAVVPEKVLQYFIDMSPQAPQQQRQENAAAAVAPRAAAFPASSSASAAAAASAAATPPPVNIDVDVAGAREMQRAQHERIQRELFHSAEEMLACMPIPSGEEMKLMSVAKLKGVMFVHGLSWEGLLEKEELVARITQYARQQQSASAHNTNNPMVRQQLEAERRFAAERRQREELRAQQLAIIRAAGAGAAVAPAKLPANSTSGEHLQRDASSSASHTVPSSSASASLQHPPDATLTNLFALSQGGSKAAATTTTTTTTTTSASPTTTGGAGATSAVAQNNSSSDAVVDALFSPSNPRAASPAFAHVTEEEADNKANSSRYEFPAVPIASSQQQQQHRFLDPSSLGACNDSNIINRSNDDEENSSAPVTGAVVADSPSFSSPATPILPGQAPRTPAGPQLSARQQQQQQEEEQQQPAISEELVERLAAMGFEDRDKVRSALRRANGNVERAVSHLLDE